MLRVSTILLRKSCASKFFSLAVAVLSIVLSGCKAAPAPDAGFISNPEVLRQDDKMPFDAVWFKDGVEFSRFKTVYVAPVDITHLLKQDWWDKANFGAGDREVQAQQLAEYFRNEVKGQFTDADANRYTVVDTPGDDTLIVELAIVEVVPTKVWLNAIGYVFLGALDQGVTAFEGRFRDGKTKDVVAEFKDREFGQMDIVSLADFEWNRHSRHTVEIWGDDLEEVCYVPPGQAIADMSTVTLRPW